MSDIQEEIKLAHKRAEENDRKDTISIQDLFNERNEQNKRIEELVLALESAEQRIDKAIQFIDNKEYYVTVHYDNGEEDRKQELLDILKGKE